MSLLRKHAVWWVSPDHRRVELVTTRFTEKAAQRRAEILNAWSLNPGWYHAARIDNFDLPLGPKDR